MPLGFWGKGHLADQLLPHTDSTSTRGFPTSASSAPPGRIPSTKQLFALGLRTLKRNAAILALGCVLSVSSEGM